MSNQITYKVTEHKIQWNVKNKKYWLFVSRIKILSSKLYIWDYNILIFIMNLEKLFLDIIYF